MTWKRKIKLLKSTIVEKETLIFLLYRKVTYI